MALALVLSELSYTDFKTSSNVINSQQAYYNAEAGVRHGIKKLQLGYFDGAYAGYNDNKNYSYDDGSNYSSTLISYSAPTKIFTIKSTGFYGGFSRGKTFEIDRYSIINLRRKFSAGDVKAVNGRVNFKTLSAGTYVNLQNYEKFLVLDKGEVNHSSNIYTFFKNEDVLRAVKNTGRYLFQNDPSDISKIYKISTPSIDRKEWKPYGVGVKYYISDKNENINLNLENLNDGIDNFLKEFKDLGGIINEEGKFLNSCVRVVFIDGNITISGIKGEFLPGITNAERYFENLIIYSTGKVTIDDSELLKSGENSDINMAIIAKEVEFLSPSGSTGSIVSYLKGNGGLVKTHENAIANLLRVNTDGEFICATGF